MQGHVLGAIRPNVNDLRAVGVSAPRNASRSDGAQ
jgi:hypothetical protein